MKILSILLPILLSPGQFPGASSILRSARPRHLLHLRFLHRSRPLQSPADPGTAVPPSIGKIDPFEILEIDRSASGEEARRAYYRLAMKFHPDTTKEDPEQARIMFQKVGEAYRILTEQPNFLNDSFSATTSGQILSQRVDEVLLGERATRAARTFAERFGFFFGENHDSLIHQHLKKRDLISAFEVYRDLREQGFRPTYSTVGMLIRGCTMAMKKYEKFENADHFSKHLWKTSMDLFNSLATFKMKPDMWTYHEAIRASSKVGHVRKVLDLFEQMTKNPFTLPTNVVTNSVLESCVTSKEYEKALMVAEEMDEIRTGNWFRGKFRADPVTFSLALKAGVEGNLFEKMPKIMRIMAKDGLYVTPPTAQKILSEATEKGKFEAAKEILLVFDSQKIKIQDETRKLVMEGKDQIPS